jgi:hypothetical protein
MLPASALLVPLCAHSGDVLTMANSRKRARVVLTILLSVIGKSPVCHWLGCLAVAMNHQRQQVTVKIRYT